MTPEMHVMIARVLVASVVTYCAVACLLAFGWRRLGWVVLRLLTLGGERMARGWDAEHLLGWEEWRESMSHALGCILEVPPQPIEPILNRLRAALVRRIEYLETETCSRCREVAMFDCEILQLGALGLALKWRLRGRSMLWLSTPEEEAPAEQG